MANFTEVNTPTSNNRRDNWEKHHVVPTQQFGLDNLADLFQTIQSLGLPEGIRYDHQLFDFNGFLLPKQLADSLAYRFAVHNGSHRAFSEFVERILRDIQAKLNVGVLTAEQAARSVRGFQAYLIDKLTVDRHVNLHVTMAIGAGYRDGIYRGAQLSDRHGQRVTTKVVPRNRAYLCRVKRVDQGRRARCPGVQEFRGAFGLTAGPRRP